MAEPIFKIPEIEESQKTKATEIWDTRKKYHQTVHEIQIKSFSRKMQTSYIIFSNKDSAKRFKFQGFQGLIATYEILPNYLSLRMSHSILLVQPNKRQDSRSYADFESVNEAMEGICKIYEEQLKKENPDHQSITYDIRFKTLKN